jgi:hypothetical protein
MKWIKHKIFTKYEKQKRERSKAYTMKKTKKKVLKTVGIQAEKRYSLKI